MEPELLLLKLTGIINDYPETTQNKLRAIDMMKHYQMFGAVNIVTMQLNLQRVID